MYSGTGKRKITLKWVYLLSVWEREREMGREKREFYKWMSEFTQLCVLEFDYFGTKLS